MKFLTLMLVSLPAILGAAVDPTPKLLYELPTDVFPAFCNILRNPLLENDPSKPVYDLVYSSFSPNPRASDPIKRIEDVSSYYLNANEMVSTTITEDVVWPNEVADVPDGIFSSSLVWAVASGFFVPGKEDGVIGLMDVDHMQDGKADPITISSNKDGILWYYHRVEWMDMNNDGYMDAVTERANGGGPAADITQLLWFENPGTTEITPEWEAHVLKENAEDVHFRLHEMPLPNGGSTIAIISSGFYSHELTVVWSDSNDWTDLSSIQSLTVDTYGWYFDVDVVDINMDGKLDILTSTWSQQGMPGAVLAYEIPDNWITEPWTRHVLQDGYKSFLLAGSGAPSTAQLFWPTEAMKSMKPYIMVSGDDDGNVYVLTADSEAQDSWDYTQTTIYKGSGTIGLIGVEDVDSDGYVDVFIPSYTLQKIVVMTYAGA